jgi:hypothetical protein
VEPNGEQRRLPFNDFKDVAGDGRLDAIVSFADTVNAAGCEPPDASALARGCIDAGQCASRG